MSSMQDAIYEQIKKTRKHKTDNIYEGAYYMAKGCRLVDKEIVNSRLIFCFEGAEMEACVREWLGGSAPVKAQALCQSHTFLHQEVIKYIDEKKGKK